MNCFSGLVAPLRASFSITVLERHFGVGGGDFFTALGVRWQALFGPRFDILLYDLTSTYFESYPPGAGKRQFGYSRDKRPDCLQVVIALIPACAGTTPEGFPLGL